MKILITNDDGNTELVHILKDKLVSLNHDVVVCVPNKNNSCVSNALKFWEYHEKDIEKIEDNFYTHDGTPADGINYYLRNFNELPDLVVSGINYGLNAGIDVLYSGTIGAASEAIVHGINAIALSSDRNYKKEELDKALDIIFTKVFESKVYSNEYIYSFNIPQNIKHNNIALCSLNSKKELKNYNNFPIKETNELMCEKHYTIETIYSDLYYLYRGYITLTPILVDRTYTNELEKMSSFFDKDLH